jgi:predicted site-specific integrase-resolvase
MIRSETFLYDESFLYGKNDDTIAICYSFACYMVGKVTKNVKLTLSTKNPKKKGYKKFSMDIDDIDDEYVFISHKDKNGPRTFELCSNEFELLQELGINKTTPFWMKAELV